MDRIVELSCQPIEISGRDRITRHAAAEAIRHDADWNNGNYDKNPSHYIYRAGGIIHARDAARIQEMAPTRAAAADQFYDDRVARIAKGDANDSLGDRVDRDLQPRVSRYSCSPEERRRSPDGGSRSARSMDFRPSNLPQLPENRRDRLSLWRAVL
jgi:hypothetical protein